MRRKYATNDSQYNGQQKKEKKTNNNLQTSTQGGGGGGWRDPISWFYLVKFLCLSPVKTWISNVIYVVVRFVFSEFRGEVIVRYLDGINNHNYLFKISFNNRS